MKEKLTILNFVYALCEHCNLNCAMCDHFAPIAQDEYANFEEFKSDFQTLSKLVNGKCRRIGLMGGEPLLCPEIEKYLEIARQCFPNTQISIVTNGLLLNDMGKDFIIACKENNIEIEYTKYPIKFDYKLAEERLTKEGVCVKDYGGTGRELKTSYFVPLKIGGGEDINWNYDNCFHSNNCIQLKHGKLYTCTVTPNVEHFNKAFGENIPVTEDDGLDIYKDNLSEDDIFEFLAKPKPFCQYCDVKNRKYGIEWGISKKCANEWSIQ